MDVDELFLRLMLIGDPLWSPCMDLFELWWLVAYSRLCL